MLDYLGVRADEQAPKTCFEHLVSSLRFMDLAGEVQADQQLHGLASITNTVKEAEPVSDEVGKFLRCFWQCSLGSRRW